MKVIGYSIFFFMTLLTNASSSNIPTQNPFRGSELKAISKNSAPTLKIYFAGNLGGMKESCGCALDPKGGFERRFNYLKKEGALSAKQDDTLIVDFGNMLFKTAEIEKKDEPDALSNAGKMIEGSNLFNFTAVNFGLLDRSLAVEKLSKLWANSRFPWLATNTNPPGRFAAGFRRRIPLKLKTGNAVIFGLTTQGSSPKAKNWEILSPLETLNKELSDLPIDTFPIVLSDLEMSELLPMASSINRPIIFIGSRETGGWDKPLEMNQALLFHLRQQGQDWGLIKFSPHAKNKSGWYSPADSEALAKRWDDLVAEAKSIKDFPASEQRNIELENVSTKIKELAKLAPRANDNTYFFETTEMNDAYNGKNEASVFMK